MAACLPSGHSSAGTGRPSSYSLPVRWGLPGTQPHAAAWSEGNRKTWRQTGRHSLHHDNADITQKTQQWGCVWSKLKDKLNQFQSCFGRSTWKTKTIWMEVWSKKNWFKRSLIRIMIRTAVRNTNLSFCPSLQHKLVLLSIPSTQTWRQGWGQLTWEQV